MTADQLKISHSAIIEDLIDSPLKVNLMELGFLPGKKITLQFKAPSNGPLAFLLENTLLALRKQEAALLQVKIIS
ncbi:FeoA family protein [Algoriphagus sp. NF]|jgi:Fe2+ transport system protein A|uniref:Ferrous iron transport protein A n=2 Tax=Algoriphagus TaxID=246875 RepID=A0ABS7N208_9BACT|nr:MULTISPECIES: FeoA family protein [Algoriphagus]MBY5950373.1 ferrous iron transport protein A [Algoriphagus marincola]MDE0560616.1 FeoA family protein [Algoriphagus sp. NF]TDK42639.1 ferrous iron transport protein A [Algoriphagus aquimaris]